MRRTGGEDKANRLGRSSREGSERGGDIDRVATTRLPPTEEGEQQISQAGHHLRSHPGAYLASILAERLVAHMMESVFDAPVASIEGQQILGGVSGRGEARDQVGDLKGGHPVGRPPPTDRHKLGQARPRRADRSVGARSFPPIRIGQRPALSPLDPTMRGFRRGVLRIRQEGARIGPAVPQDRRFRPLRAPPLR